MSPMPTTADSASAMSHRHHLSDVVQQLGHWWSDLRPAAGAAVMATGIVSVGLHLVHSDLLSDVLLWLAAALWLVLAVAFATRLAKDRPRWTAEARQPPALTAVAATTVLGTRIALAGGRPVAAALLAIAALAWPVLIVAVMRSWKRRMPGAVFLICVSTQGLVVLATTLGGPVLNRAGLVVFCGGLVLYFVALFRFDITQIVKGAGDQWVAGGAMAISTLAASKLVAAPTFSGTLHAALRGITFALLAISVAWYIALLVAELGRPRVRYDVRRWASVFPLGMTAVATLSTGAATGNSWMHPIGVVLLWIAAAAWAFTLAMMIFRPTLPKRLAG